jgi:hypothetical protein
LPLDYKHPRLLTEGLKNHFTEPLKPQIKSIFFSTNFKPDSSRVTWKMLRLWSMEIMLYPTTRCSRMQHYLRERIFRTNQSLSPWNIWGKQVVSKMFVFLLNCYTVCDYQVSRSKYLFLSSFHAVSTATSFYFCHPTRHTSEVSYFRKYPAQITYFICKEQLLLTAWYWCYSLLLLLLLLLLLFTAIEFSLGGSSPYTSNK